MKQILYLIITLLFTSAVSQGQDSLHLMTPNPDVKYKKDPAQLKYSAGYYSLKSSKTKTAGWVLLSAGTVMGVAGLIVYENNLHTEYTLVHFDDAVANSVGAECLIVAGSAMVAVSIPLFITSAHYRKKALEMTANMKIESYRQPFLTGMAVNHIPALGVNIRF